mmetsp:Transcript_24712/g.57059  ORF Transcript_24712/g.57059 Transcript_24712/m.57059 type:complete len:386 (+) Transcript_24712:110-1267(+)
MLQLAFFDFDLTLSACHVFGNLSGRDASLGLKPPFAKTELGQVVLIGELDKSRFRDSPGGFVTAAFGGAQRIESLRGLLTDLQNANVECVVCTRGYVGPVRKLLHQSGLSSFFNFVYGELGSAYGKDEFDQKAPKLFDEDDAKFIGESKHQLPGGKQPLIQQYMAARGIGGHEVLFLDDDANEINHVQGTCQTLQVSAQGIGAKEIHILRSLAGITPAEAAVAAASSARGAAIQRQRSNCDSRQHRSPGATRQTSARGNISAAQVNGGNGTVPDFRGGGSIRAPVEKSVRPQSNGPIGMTPRNAYSSPQTPHAPVGLPGTALNFPFAGGRMLPGVVAPPQVVPSLIQAVALDHRVRPAPQHVAVRMPPSSARHLSMFAPSAMPRW